jgi:hypothetical protein
MSQLEELVSHRALPARGDGYVCNLGAPPLDTTVAAATFHCMGNTLLIDWQISRCHCSRSTH